MSRFLPAVVAVRAMARLGVPNRALKNQLPGMAMQGLQRLYNFQHDDGGWGWWKYDKTNPEMTAYVVFGLATAARAGFPVDKSTLERGVQALQEMEPTPFAVYAQSVAGKDVKDLLDQDSESVEDRAYLVLAGKRDLARLLGRTQPDGNGPGAVREIALTIRAIASVDPRDPLPAGWKCSGR